MSNEDLRHHPAVLAAEETCKRIEAEIRDARRHPERHKSPKNFIMPSSMMQGVQIDADQLPPAE